MQYNCALSYYVCVIFMMWITAFLRVIRICCIMQTKEVQFDSEQILLFTRTQQRFDRRKIHIRSIRVFLIGAIIPKKKQQLGVYPSMCGVADFWLVLCSRILNTIMEGWRQHNSHQQRTHSSHRFEHSPTHLEIECTVDSCYIPICATQNKIRYFVRKINWT